MSTRRQRFRRLLGDMEQEVLLWYDAEGKAYPTPDEIIQATQSQLIAQQQKAEAEQQRANAERQRADQLAEYLRSLGVDPDNLPNS